MRWTADHGDVYAQYRMGWGYSVGDRVEKDGKETIKWYRIAAEQGNSNAKEVLKELEVE